MKYFLPISIFALTASVTALDLPIVTERGGRKAPIHSGINNELAAYKAQYETLAFLHGIKFKKTITLGFAHLRMKKNDKYIIGLCTYGKSFREIDVDYQYWRDHSYLTRRTLIFHELTHCLCSRLHTWGDGLDYPEISYDISDPAKKKIIKIDLTETKASINGFMDDKCPMSIMYPRIISDTCMESHQKIYLEEMFDSCTPY